VINEQISEFMKLACQHKYSIMYCFKLKHLSNDFQWLPNENNTCNWSYRRQKYNTRV